MKTLVFRGYLNKLYPEGIQVEADSAYEAVSLLSNFPGFRPDDGVIHRVVLPGFRTLDAAKTRTDSEVIEVVPLDMVDEESFAGAGKNGGWIQIIIGAVLMYFSYGTVGYEMVFSAGLALALGGVLSLLMPAPKKADGNGNDPKSNYLAANKNTVAIGTVIPLGFGRRKVYGHLLSFNVTATNLNAAAPNAEENTATGTALGNNTVYYRGDWLEHDSGGEAPDDGDAPDSGTGAGDNGTGD